MGDADRYREECVSIGNRQQRVARRTEYWAELLHDARYAARQLRRSPAFTTVVVLALALGIGINLVVFGLVNGLILNPLPGVAHAGRIALVENRVLSYPEYRDYRDANHAEFEGIGAFRRRITVAAKLDGAPILVTAGVVSGNFFTLTGARPSLGRTILPTDDQAGAPPSVLLSYGFWKRALAGDSAALGSTMLLNGQAYTIVGVGEPRFHGLQLTSPSDIWIPISTWPLIAPSGFSGLTIETRGWGWLTMFVVTKPGVDLARAEAPLTRTGGQLKEIYRDQMPEKYQLTLVPAAIGALPDGRGIMVQFFTILATVVLLVMLLAIANVANLILARTAHRHQEIGVRRAIGAGGWRLARQFMTEALVLSLLAGTTAIGLMLLAFRLLQGFSFPGGMTIGRLGVGDDPMLFVVAAAAVLVTTMVLGAIPAIRALRGDTMRSLRGNPAGSGQPRSRLQTMLLATQIALGMVLLVGAALFTRGLQRALSIDPGVQTERILTATVDAGLARLTPDQASQYFTRSIERVLALPGVEDAGWSAQIPLTSDESVEEVSIDGYKDAEGNDPVIEVIPVSSAYLPTVGIPLVRGNYFESSAPLGERHAVIIGEAAAARYWPGTDPLGRRVVIGGDTAVVVGITRDIGYHDLTSEPPPVMYRPLAGRPMQTGVATLTLFVRTSGRPEDISQAVERELLSVNPDVPVFDVEPFEDRIADLLLPQRLGFQLLGGFGTLALIIAAVGVYGVVGYVVARRTREVGIRMALGETPGSVINRMVRENLTPVVLGAGAGIVLAVAGAQALSGLLYGLSPADPFSYALSIGILLLASLIAAVIPARRASRVSPMTALRME
jgi:predicted permease